MKRIFQFIICVAIPLMVGGLSAYTILVPLAEWYPTITKPSFNPPNAVFGPVWTALYVLMGIGLFLVVKEESGSKRTTAILVFALQLILNYWWSAFFFNFKHIEVAMVEILCLWFSIVWMIFAFRAVKPVAAYLQIPYLLWVTFATILNIAIWMLN